MPVLPWSGNGCHGVFPDDKPELPHQSLVFSDVLRLFNEVVIDILLKLRGRDGRERNG